MLLSPLVLPARCGGGAPEVTAVFQVKVSDDNEKK